MISLEVLFDLSDKCIDLLDTLKEKTIEIEGFIFTEEDSELVIELTEAKDS